MRAIGPTGARLAPPIAAVLIAVGVSAVIIALSGANVATAGRAIVEGAFGSRNRTASTLSKTIPISLAAMGWIVAFKVGRINVGLEGQMIMGGIAATWVGVYVTAPAPVHLAAATLAAAIAGAAYAAIAGALWARRGVNEIISALMLNLIAVQILSWLLRGPMQESSGTFNRSEPLGESARWPRLLIDTALGWDFILAITMVAVGWFALTRTTLGYRLRITGANPDAAAHVGLPTVGIAVGAFAASGALGGLAGSTQILGGETTSLSDNFTAGFGFVGIVVALLARNTPVGVLPGALFFAVLLQGGGTLESRAGVPVELVLITQGLVILLVAGSSFATDAIEARIANITPEDLDTEAHL